jgi:GH18 family chitinase
MARHIANRTMFIQSTMRIMELYELDGLDFYWKYPGLNGGREEDVETFVKIMKV